MTKKIIKKTGKKFCKELLKPITIEPKPSYPSAGARAIWPELKEQSEKENAAWAMRSTSHKYMESTRKMGLLLEHYGLERDDPNNWFLLAFYLAQQFIPGFQTETKARSGRPRTWNSTWLTKLYLAVEEKKQVAKTQKKRVTIENICHHLAKEEPWKTLSNNKDGVLYDRYIESRKAPMIALLTSLEKDYPDARTKLSAVLEKI